jgi:hypothetical protein
MGVDDMKRKPYIVLTNGNTLEPQTVMPSALNDLYNRNKNGEPPTKAPFFSTQFEAELIDDILRLQKENKQLKEEMAKLYENK